MAIITQAQFLNGASPKNVKLITPASSNPGVPPSQVKKGGFLSDVVDSAKKRIGNIGEAFNRSGAATEAGSITGQNPFETALQAVGNVVGFGGDVIGAGLSAATPEIVKQKGLDLLKTETGQQAISALQSGAEVYKTWATKNPRAAADIESVLNIASIIPAKKVADVGIDAAAKTIKAGSEIAEATSRGAKNVTHSSRNYLFGKPLGKNIGSVDDLIAQSDKLLEKPSTIRSGSLLDTAQRQSPPVSIIEKWAGVRPDIKKQIQGKYDQLKTYFDVSHARNLDVNVPTPLEFGVSRAKTAREIVGASFDDTGSAIGKFREKIKTYQIPMDKIQGVVNDFDSELSKLNLKVKNGQVVRAPGSVKKIADSEIKLLQDFRENLNVIRERPTVDTVIQNRIAADANINFAKSAREASNTVDPISRKIRAKLAEINRSVIGKSESKLLEDYSDLAGFIEEFDGYLNRRAGGEFMLKRVLSERGGDTRRLINTLKEYTGIDLLDDATMAQIATDLIGNADQVGLFRKEIQKAGLDAAALLQGDKMGAARMLLNYGKSKVANPEKVFLRASKK